MTDWTPVDHPFADPTNPDIAVETELWHGGPKPQGEVQRNAQDRAYTFDAAAGKSLSDLIQQSNAEINKLMTPRVSGYVDPISGMQVSPGGFITIDDLKSMNATKKVIADDMEKRLSAKADDLLYGNWSAAPDPRHPISKSCVCSSPEFCMSAGKCKFGLIDRSWPVPISASKPEGRVQVTEKWDPTGSTITIRWGESEEPKPRWTKFREWLWQRWFEFRLRVCRWLYDLSERIEP